MNQVEYEPIVLFQLIGFHPDPNERKEYFYAFEDLTPVNWSAFKHRLINHPKEASFQRYCTFFQRELQYPLHCALSISDHPIPPDVLAKLIQAYPGVLRKECLDRIAFLMFVNSKISLESIQVLLNFCPSLASTLLRDKKLPLHISSFESSKLLMNIFPQAIAVPDINGCIPLWFAIRHQTTCHVQFFLEEGLKHFVGTNGAAGLFIKNKTGENCFELALRKAKDEIKKCRHSFRIQNFFHKFCLCLQTITASKLKDCEQNTESIFTNHLIVHAAIEFGKDYSLIEHACQQFPADITRLDHLKRTALSICIENWEEINFSNETLDSNSCNELSNKRNLISILCVDKMCSIPDVNGDLPLTQFVKKNHLYNPKIIDDLIKAEPRQLETRHRGTHLYPFLTAAVGNNTTKEDTTTQLDTVFDLLLANPMVIGYII